MTAPVPNAASEKIKKNALIAMIVGFVCGGVLPGVLGLLGYLKADQEPETARKFTKWAWIVFAIVLVLSAIGMTTSYVLTGRKLHAAEVPMWPIYVGIAAGIVGFFVIPLLGLPIGFVLGLCISEAVRQKDLSKGLGSAWIAVKALGVGIMIEFSLAMLSTIVFAVGVVVHFVTA